MLTNPIWVVNTRMTAGKRSMDDSDSPPPQRKSSVNAWAALKQMVREEGPGSLWHGVMPALILVSNPSIQYMVHLVRYLFMRVAV